MFEQKSESQIHHVCDPPVSRHRPSSDKSQDISHFLANIYKYIYTSDVISKETVAKLKKSRRGDNSYHEKYLDDLEQAHAQYSRRLKDADALEKHIIQARERAAAAEEFARSNLLEDIGEAYGELGLPPVKSAFRWCVDNSLLKSNSLICPEDYSAGAAQLIKAPKGKCAPGFAKATIAYNMRICRLAKDDGYTVSPETDRRPPEMPESEGTLTLPSTPESIASSSKIPSKTRRPAGATALTGSSRAEVEAALLRLSQRGNFLRNPRFPPHGASRGGKSLLQVTKAPDGEEGTPDQSAPVFLASPSSIIFSQYRVGQVYETTVELRNVTSASRHVRVIPPGTPHFTLGLGKFPGDGGVVAPGMSCHYTVLFAPDSLANFQDCLLVETQDPFPLVVPIEARRPPPVLTLPRVLDCGYCLVGGAKVLELQCSNVGLSGGTFCIMPKKLWPASSLRAVVTASFAELPPFGVSPSLFELQPGQDTVVEVAFFPTAADSFSEVFTVVCDNCQVRDISIQGTGQLVTLQLVSVTGGEEWPMPGELCDFSAQHLVRFGPTNPQCTLQKELVIRNNAHLVLPFRWQIMKPNLQPHLFGERAEPPCSEHHVDTDAAFDISPADGQLLPHQDHRFLLSYRPEELKDYHSVLHLVLMDIPDPPEEHDSDGTLHHLERAANVNDIVVMEIEVKGLTEPRQVLLEPYAILFPGETYVGAAVRKHFKMWNNSKSGIRFQWDRISDCHVVEVKPPAGEIGVSKCCDLELVLIGRMPGPFTCHLPCHIEHCRPGAVLVVQAAFKGPKLSISVPSLDLGLIRLGEQVCSSILVTNSTELDASWMLQECCEMRGPRDAQVTVEPCRGVLPPLSSCTVDVFFKPVACQHFETVLQLAVENGTGCNLLVQADVQSTQVCLLRCQLEIPELFVGVPANGIATLFNQTLLPTRFSWMEQLQGQQASLCMASFSPCTGTLGPNAKLEVAVQFTAHTDVQLTEVAAVCKVEGMREPLLLGIFCKAEKLRISFSLPDGPEEEAQDPSALMLDFGDEVLLKRAVTKRLAITNHTAITAGFTMEAEYFTVPRAPSPPTDEVSRFGHRTSNSRRPLHSLHAKQMEKKAHEDFVSALLAHGKGAAFYIQPASGTLGPYKTQTVDVTAFTSMWGQYRDRLVCKVGDLEPVFVPVTMTVKGCALHFQLMGPQPESQTQGPVVRFGTHVSGGDTISRAIRINNTSHYDIRLDWETFNQERGDMMLLDLLVTYGDPFPLKDPDGNEVLGGGSGSGGNNGASAGGTSASIASESVTEEESNEEEAESCGLKPPRKLISVHVRIHEGNASDYPYCITPRQMVVPAGGSSTVHVSFTPLTLSGSTRDFACLGFGLGFMSLDCEETCCVPGRVERAQGLQLEPLRLDLQANVKAALLCVETEEDKMLEFYAIASDLLLMGTEQGVEEPPAVTTRSFRLRNPLEMPVYFRLSVQPPFCVLPPWPRSSTQSPCDHAREPPYLVLQPRHNLQVKVAFHCSLSLLATPGSPSEETPPTPQLISSVTGGRSLRFHQSLLVEYSNGSIQEVPLCGFLSLPTLHLIPDSLDFGTCYVGQTSVKEVILSNRGRSSSHWAATIESVGGGGSFEVTPSRGVLRPKLPLCSCRHPLQISFTPRDTSEARATVTVQGILGELPVSLQVWGRGSFDEAYVTAD
uniref:DLEC1 cilia and flagella associated protein n=1 Tax=Paramormyrops kingsleyae TaxID=1676925 RepID=A0A3B3SJ92_9TELE|nr:deleted in lung and esophageal cancer protein 1 isoform X1 [Paramormyrops kingsleyae]